MTNQSSGESSVPHPITIVMLLTLLWAGIRTLTYGYVGPNEWLDGMSMVLVVVGSEPLHDYLVRRERRRASCASAKRESTESTAD